MGQYTKNLMDLMPRKFVLAVFLMVLMSLTEAASLVILIPLLELVGFDLGQESLGQITGFISYFFNVLGVQPTLPLVLGLYVLIVSIGAIILRWQNILSYEIEFNFAAHLRKRLYRAITNSNWLFFTRFKSSDFAHALTNEIERISTGTYSFLDLISSIMILLVYVLFALKLEGIITGMILVIALIILFLLRRRIKRSLVRGEEITSTTQDIYSSIIQHMDGMKTIKSLQMEDENLKIFSDQTDQVANRYLDAIRSYVDVKVLFDIGTVVVLALVVLILIQVVHISTAALILLIYIFVRMIPLFYTVQNSYQYFITMLPAFANVIKLERDCLENSDQQLSHGKIKKHEIVQSEAGSKGNILDKGVLLVDVSFHYDDHRHFGIKDLNLHIASGKTTAIVGQSGAGKTTIADLLMDIIRPASGKITYNGINVSQLAESWKKRIGYVAQDTFLFNESIRFNLLIARPDAHEKELEEALKMAAADEFVYNLPHGLDTVIGDRGVRLSGGEKQRLALARALLRKPSLLIMDEATSNLDSDNENKILKSIDDLHGEVTILMIAHRLSTIKNADHIYLLEGGKILESGSWDELIRKRGYFWDICEAQGIN